jgi:arylsulfatase A-like enzyme
VTAAAVAFCCAVALALAEGFGAPAFAMTIASDAINAALPFLGLLLIARFAAFRAPHREVLIARLHSAAQGLVAGMSFGWWWLEPHAFLTSFTTGSLPAMAWLAIAGAIGGFVLALVAERAASPLVFREVWLGAAVLFLFGGGHVYRVYDQVEAGIRLTTACVILASIVAAGLVAYYAFRRRPRAAAAVPALAPAVACLALVAATMQGGPAELSTRESVLLVLVDTLRADIADAGMPGIPPSMPELTRIAQSGVRFTQAVSPAPWTLPATVSLLSGWNPHRHGFGASATPLEVTTGHRGALYLPGKLRDAGYLTAAFVHNPWLRPYFGFGPGFYSMRPYHGRALDGVALALGWLSDRADDASFTLLHLMDPHWPYEAPPGFGDPPQFCPSCTSIMAAQYGSPHPGEKAELRRRYAAEVRFTDAMIGRMYDTLTATTGNGAPAGPSATPTGAATPPPPAGAATPAPPVGAATPAPPAGAAVHAASAGGLENTWLIITADHGEEFWEHNGFLHGHALYDELLHVPLVVVPPRGRADIARGRRIDAQVRLEDVAATVLDIAGLDASLAPDGRSLLPMLLGRDDAEPRTQVSGYVKAVGDFSYAVRRPPWKAIVRNGPPANFLFHLGEDPMERKNLLMPANQTPANRKALGLAFLSLRDTPARLGLEPQTSAPVSGGAAPDADTQQKLRSLGYAD